MKDTNNTIQGWNLTKKEKKISGAAYRRKHLRLEFSNIILIFIKTSQNWKQAIIDHCLFHESWLLKMVFVCQSVHLRSLKPLIFPLTYRIKLSLNCCLAAMFLPLFQQKRESFWLPKLGIILILVTKTCSKLPVGSLIKKIKNPAWSEAIGEVWS